MVEHLATAIEEEQYYCKALSNETIKINVTTSESYRKLIKQLQQEKIVHHTYQIREERAYRVVIRNLHHSVTTDEIKREIRSYRSQHPEHQASTNKRTIAFVFHRPRT
jgi:selenocysteine-specific translation elongation factor